MRLNLDHLTRICPHPTLEPMKLASYSFRSVLALFCVLVVVLKINLTDGGCAPLPPRGAPGNSPANLVAGVS
jgi:hypothetical protein